jgi:hypothetical protein
MKDFLDMKHLPKFGAVKKVVRRKSGKWSEGNEKKLSKLRRKLWRGDYDESGSRKREEVSEQIKYYQSHR